MSYIILRGRWCDVILKVRGPTEDKTDMKDNFCEELECVFDTSSCLKIIEVKGLKISVKIKTPACLHGPVQVPQSL
jgi:hypothetical protein